MNSDPELLALLRDLPDELPPERDLWPEVRERIDPPKARRSAVLPLAAVGVVLLAVVSWLDAAPAAGWAASDWEAGVHRSAAALSQAAATAPEDLTPEMRARIDAELRTIEGALDTIRAAVDVPPSN